MFLIIMCFFSNIQNSLLSNYAKTNHRYPMSLQKTTATLTPYYLPCIEYFVLISYVGHIILEKKEHFVKQTYRNRTYVLTTNGIQRLTVPIKKQGQRKVPYEAIAIDYSQSWQDTHWRCLQTAYGKSPFFAYYADTIKEMIHANYELLYKLNVDLLTFFLKSFNLHTSISHTDSYEPILSEQYDFRTIIDHKQKTRIDKNIYYYQAFGEQFVPNLSIIDLLFAKGPEAFYTLMEYKKNYPFNEIMALC